MASVRTACTDVHVRALILLSLYSLRPSPFLPLPYVPRFFRPDPFIYVHMGRRSIVDLAGLTVFIRRP